MTIEIIIDHMSMYCSINMWNLKRLYRCEWDNLAYLDYGDDCLKNNECEFKATFVVGM